MRKRRFIGAVAAPILMMAAPIHAQPALAKSGVIVTGDYDNMLIGFNPATGLVTGYFDEYIGGPPGPTFSCIVYLSGKLDGSVARVAAYAPETADDRTKGELFLESPPKFRLQLHDEDRGCEEVGHFADPDRRAEFTIKTRYPWTSVVVVKSKKAYFFDAPTSAKHRRGYVVKGDGVGVRATKPGWLQVDYVYGEKRISGWIRQSDVYPSN